VQVDPPFNDGVHPERILSDEELNEICLEVQNHLYHGTHNNAFDYRFADINAIISLISDVRIPENEVNAFALYWSDATCTDNWGNMIQRIARRIIHQLQA
jgi:hypothetical protein